MTTPAAGPHQGLPVREAGAGVRQASCAVILLHGRGSNGEDILGLAPLLEHPAFTFMAPEARDGTWYPYSFLAPLDANEPNLSSALAAVAAVVDAARAAGIPAARTILGGFSQGACLALEFAARNARRYGGLVGLSGGLIGPDGTPREYEGSLEGTPVFLGCSDRDPHIPEPRVHESARVLERLGGRVTTRIYQGLGHTVIDDELDAVRAMMREVADDLETR